MLVCSVYNFGNYREFLADYYRSRKRIDPTYSYKRFALDGKLGSPNILKLVMEGNKNLSNASIQKFAAAAKLSPSENDYFETLVHFCQAEDAKVKAFYKKRLVLFKRARSVGADDKTYAVVGKTSLFDNPLYPVFAILISGENVDTAADKLQKFSMGTLASSMDFISKLLSEGHLQVVEGQYQMNFSHAVFHKNPSNEKLKRYLLSQMEFSKSALKASYDANAKFFSHSMGIAEDGFASCVQEFSNFIASVNSRYDCSCPQKVLQFNAQLFIVNQDILQDFENSKI